MANHIYPKFTEACRKGTVDLVNDTLKLVMVTSGYTYSDTHEFLDDVDAGYIIDETGDLAGRTFDGETFDVSDPAISSPATGTVAAILQVDGDTSTPTTCRLVSYHEVAATLSGADIVIVVDADGILKPVPA